MTFCLGIKIESGLIGIADSRLTAGNVTTTARKVSVHQHGRHSLFLMTSGLRSVRDKALTYFQEVLEDGNDSYGRLYQVVNAFAEQVRRVAREDKPSLLESGLSFNLHALVGGQLERDGEHKLYMLYPEGNWVEVGQGSPYFIIGNSGYGKPLLDRVLRYDSPMDLALKAGLLAFDATRTSANDVDYPLDVVLYKKDSYDFIEHRFEKESTQEPSQWWGKVIAEAVEKLPSDWMKPVLDRL
jgi:putative proteasome-type protease